MQDINDTTRGTLNRIAQCIERATKNKQNRIVYILNDAYTKQTKENIIDSLIENGYIVSNKTIDFYSTELIISWRV